MLPPDRVTVRNDENERDGLRRVPLTDSDMVVEYVGVKVCVKDLGAVCVQVGVGRDREGDSLSLRAADAEMPDGVRDTVHDFDIDTMRADMEALPERVMLSVDDAPFLVSDIELLTIDV